MSKVTIELEVTDELAKAVAKLNGAEGSAMDYEVQAWAKEELEVAVDDLINLQRE